MKIYKAKIIKYGQTIEVEFKTDPRILAEKYSDKWEAAGQSLVAGSVVEVEKEEDPNPILYIFQNGMTDGETTIVNAETEGGER